MHTRMHTHTTTTTTATVPCAFRSVRCPYDEVPRCRTSYVCSECPRVRIRNVYVGSRGGGG